MVCSWEFISKDGEKIKELLKAMLGLEEWNIEVSPSVRLGGDAYSCDDSSVFKKITTLNIRNIIRIKPIEPDEENKTDDIPGDILWVITVDDQGYFIPLNGCNYAMRKIIEENELCENVCTYGEDGGVERRFISVARVNT